MNNEQFQTILSERVKAIHGVLGIKAKEYAMNGDRLHNFKVAARANNTTPEKALWGMATKHLVSVMDLVNGDLEASTHNIDEKCGDLINYIILLEAILKEDKNEHKIKPIST